jgi:hypothetical protein
MATHSWEAKPTSLEVLGNTQWGKLGGLMESSSRQGFLAMVSLSLLGYLIVKTSPYQVLIKLFFQTKTFNWEEE